MSRRRTAGNCCCLGECRAFTDDFNREDNTNLNVPGNYWTEVIGDSAIDSNQVKIPGPGLIATTAVNRGVDGRVYVTVPANSFVPQRQHRLIINYLDEDNYIFAEIETGVGTVENADIRLFNRVEGANNLLDSGVGLEYPLLQDAAFLLLCRTETGVYFQCPGFFGGNHLLFSCVPVDNLGRKGGLGNGGSNDIWFDTFGLKEGYQTDPLCPKCFCECVDETGDHCVPHELTLEIEATDLCVCQHGLTVPLTLDEELFPEFVWKGSATLPYFDCNSGQSGLHEFKLECSENWQLTTTATFSCQNVQTPVVVSCDPFYLEYDWELCYGYWGPPPPGGHDECHQRITIYE